MARKLNVPEGRTLQQVLMELGILPKEEPTTPQEAPMPEVVPTQDVAPAREPASEVPMLGVDQDIFSLIKQKQDEGPKVVKDKGTTTVAPYISTPAEAQQQAQVTKILEDQLLGPAPDSKALLQKASEQAKSLAQYNMLSPDLKPALGIADLLMPKEDRGVVGKYLPKDERIDPLAYASEQAKQLKDSMEERNKLRVALAKLTNMGETKTTDITKTTAGGGSEMNPYMLARLDEMRAQHKSNTTKNFYDQNKYEFEGIRDALKGINLEKMAGNPAAQGAIIGKMMSLLKLAPVSEADVGRAKSQNFGQTLLRISEQIKNIEPNSQGWSEAYTQLSKQEAGNILSLFKELIRIQTGGLTEKMQRTAQENERPALGLRSDELYKNLETLVDKKALDFISEKQPVQKSAPIQKSAPKSEGDRYEIMRKKAQERYE